MVIVTVFLAAYSFAQDKPSLTIEDIYNGAYRAKGFGPVRWMKDDRGYSTLEANKESGGRDIA